MSQEKLWHCYNCQTSYTGGEKCPKCGLAHDAPEAGTYIVGRETIHFTDPHPVIKNKGCGVKLCDGKPYDGSMVTGMQLAATCAKCLKKLADRDHAEPLPAAG